jgi:pSer/pThr/pTyr-binding forkhead associated (FHA) protein
MVHVTKNMKIGRNSANDIVLRTDGVSRNHAEILVEELPDA